MAAYVIVETNITDPDQYAQYRAASPGTLTEFGGRFVVRGGELEVLEGDWSPTRLVVTEFPNMDAVRAWYASPGYQAAKALRDGAGDAAHRRGGRRRRLSPNHRGPPPRGGRGTRGSPMTGFPATAGGAQTPRTSLVRRSRRRRGIAGPARKEW